MTSNLQFSAPLEVEARAGNPPRVSILAYNGGPLKLPNYSSPVVVELSSLQLPGQIPLLLDHANKIDSVAGQGTPRVENGRLFVEGTLASNDAAKKILELNASGVPLQASIGVSVTTDPEPLRQGQQISVNGQSFDGPLYIVRRAQLREVSLVALGVDNQTTVSIAAAWQHNQKQPEGVPTMETTQTPDLGQLKAINAALADGADYLDRGEIEALRAAAIDNEIDLPGVQRRILAAMRQSLSAAAPSNAIPSSRPGLTQSALEAALLLRAGQQDLAEKSFDERVLEAAWNYSKSSMIDLFRETQRAQGRPVPTSSTEAARAILASFPKSGDVLEAAVGLSTVSLPVALGNAMNKSLLASYREYPQTWQSFAAIRSANDKKVHKSLRPFLTDDLVELPEGGDFKATSLTEQTFEFALKTYGRIVTMSRDAILNDDLSMLDEVGPLLGRAAAKKVGDLVWQHIMSNAGSFFSEGHGNLETSAALSAGSLGNAIMAMRTQKDPAGLAVDIRPRVLVVPPELEYTARAILQSSELEQTVADEPRGNPLQGVVRLEVEPRLSNSSFTGYSATDWYLAASPSDAPILVAFLGGHRGPTTEFFDMSSTVERLQVSWRIFHDVGVADGDYRAISKQEASS